MSIKEKFLELIMPIYIKDRDELEIEFLELLTTEMTLPKLLENFNNVSDKEVSLYKVRQITLGLYNLGLVRQNTENLLCPKYKTNEHKYAKRSHNSSNQIIDYREGWNT